MNGHRIDQLVLVPSLKRNDTILHFWVPKYADSEGEIAMIHVDHRDLPREEFDGERGSMQFGDWGMSGFPTPRGQGGPVCIHHCINQRQWWEFKAQSCLHFLPVLSKKKGSLPFAQYLSLEQLNLQTKSCVRRVNNSCYIVFSFCSFLVVCKFHYFDTNETTWQSYYTSLRTTLLYRNYIKYLPLSRSLCVCVCWFPAQVQGIQLLLLCTKKRKSY